ncbi:MAG TPA: hypothetical protein VGW38_23280, partial [Chloroflexota bacterium]|nr:hypothetical protein [Chloroflexota bacterium]
MPGNEFDTRVTIIGDWAFAFRRFNRPNHFRASGSGRIDWDSAQIAPGAVRLSFRVARRLQSECMAVDVLRRGEEYVINEISYTFASWAVRDCPGHWVLDEGSGTRRLNRHCSCSACTCTASECPGPPEAVLVIRSRRRTPETSRFPAAASDMC